MQSALKFLLVIVFVVGFIRICAVMASYKSAPAASAAPASCTEADFTVSKPKVRMEYEYARLTGVVRNNCAVAASPEAEVDGI